MGSSIRIRNHVRSVIDPDGAVLLNLKEGKYFSLNGIGAQIWLKLEAGSTVPEIETHLNCVYNTPAETLRRDLMEFLEELKRREMIDVRN
jgi:hypothetical protein